MYPTDRIYGNTCVGEVYVLSLTGGNTHVSTPLSVLWPCNLQAATRRDIEIGPTYIANQYIAIGEPVPLIEGGWKILFYSRAADGGKGQKFLGTFHVTDPDPYVSDSDDLHHQEIHLMRIDVNS